MCRKVIFSDPSPLIGSTEEGGSFPKISIAKNLMKCPNLYRKPMLTTPSSWCGIRVNLQKKVFFLEIAWNVQNCTWNWYLATPPPQNKGVKCQFMKNIHDGNSAGCQKPHKTYVFYSLTSTGGWAQFTKNFAENYMKCTELHRNWLFGNLWPMGGH